MKRKLLINAGVFFFALLFTLQVGHGYFPSNKICWWRRCVIVHGGPKTLERRGEMTNAREFSPKRNIDRPKYQPTLHKKTKYCPIKKRMRTFPTAFNESHYSLSSEGLASTLTQLVRMGSPDEALRLLSLNNTMFGVRDYNMLMKELGDGGHMDECALLLSMMKNAQIRPTVITYGTLISRAGTWRGSELAEFYFQHMQTDGLRPDVQAFNSLMNAYAKRGDTDRALSVLSSMDSMDVEPSIITMNTLIDSCARDGTMQSLQKALDIVAMMQRRGLTLDMRTYSSLIHCCTEAGDMTTALSLFGKMQTKGLAPTGVTFSLLLHGLGRVGDLVKAFEVLESMNKYGISANVVTMSSLVHACARHGRMADAFRLYREMLGSADSAAWPNSITCSALIDACLKTGRVDEAFGVLQDMKTRSILLTQVTYTSLISELKSLKQVDRLYELDLFRPLQSKGGTVKIGAGTRTGAGAAVDEMGGGLGSPSREGECW